MKENGSYIVLFIAALALFVVVFKGCANEPDKQPGQDHGHHTSPPTRNEIVSTTISTELDQAQMDLFGFVDLYCIVENSGQEVEFNGEIINKDKALELVENAVTKYNALEKPDYAMPNVSLDDEIACQGF